jgi:hypothetical protein
MRVLTLALHQEGVIVFSEASANSFLLLNIIRRDIDVRLVHELRAQLTIKH